MKLYYAGMIGEKILRNHSTEKAFYSAYDSNGFGKGKPVWIPKSICKFSEPNECGWVEVYIPQWWFMKNPALDFRRLRDIEWTVGGKLIVEL